MKFNSKDVQSILDSISYKYRKTILSDFIYFSDVEASKIQDLINSNRTISKLLPDIADILNGRISQTKNGLYFLSNQCKSDFPIPSVSADELIDSSNRLSSCLNSFDFQLKPRQGYSDSMNFLKVLNIEQIDSIRSINGLDTTKLSLNQQSVLHKLFIGAYLSGLFHQVKYFQLHFNKIRKSQLIFHSLNNQNQIGLRIQLPDNSYFNASLQEQKSLKVAGGSQKNYPQSILNQAIFSLSDICEQANTKSDLQKLTPHPKSKHKPFYCSGTEFSSNRSLAYAIGECLDTHIELRNNIFNIEKRYPSISDYSKFKPLASAFIPMNIPEKMNINSIKTSCQNYIQSHNSILIKSKKPVPWDDLPFNLQNIIALFFYCEIIDSFDFLSDSPPAYISNPEKMNLSLPDKSNFNVRFRIPGGWRNVIGYGFGSPLPDSLFR